MTQITVDRSTFTLVEESVLRLFAKYGTLHDHVSRKNGNESKFNKQGWEDVHAAGLLFAMLDEAHDGLGIEGAMIIARLAGEHGLALPLCEAMVANWILVAAGLEAVEGLVVFAEHPAHLTVGSEGWRVSGTARSVPWGRYCDLVVTMRHEQRLHAVRIERNKLSVTLGENAAGEPRDVCVFDCILPARSFAPLPDGWQAQSTQLLGAALRTMQIAGAARATLAMTVSYTGQRRQFGRSIGSFQAVQQLLAIMATHAAAAGVAGDLAVAGALGQLDETRIAVAKSRASEAAGAVAAIAHQVHGAIGYTREHALHTLTHRLLSWRDEFGSDSHWATILGHQLGTRGGSALWPALTDI